MAAMAKRRPTRAPQRPATIDQPSFEARGIAGRRYPTFIARRMAMRSFRDRYLLCRPQGGLNDTLCQIEKCWNYASKFNRILIIDTRNSGLHAPFSNFFIARRPSPRVHFAPNDEMMELLNTLSCYPPKVGGKLHQLDLAQLRATNFVVKEDHSIPFTFDFSEDYAHEILAHERCGGGRKSFEILGKLQLAPGILPVIRKRTAHLGTGYFAVHVRNTDLKTNYVDLFERISPVVQGKCLLVCSDDASVISHAKAFFSKSDILTSSDIPDTGGNALHYFGDVKKHAIDAIVDLIALGRADKVFFSTPKKGSISGFSDLASHLSRNKYIVRRWLQEPGPNLQLTAWRFNDNRRRAKKAILHALSRARCLLPGATRSQVGL